jgi:hypothetical protein
MQERQIALHPGHHSSLHKLVEYIILAAERRRSVTISAASESFWRNGQIDIGWRRRNGPAANP